MSIRVCATYALVFTEWKWRGELKTCKDSSRFPIACMPLETNTNNAPKTSLILMVFCLVCADGVQLHYIFSSSSSEIVCATRISIIYYSPTTTTATTLVVCMKNDHLSIWRFGWVCKEKNCHFRLTASQFFFLSLFYATCYFLLPSLAGPVHCHSKSMPNRFVFVSFDGDCRHHNVIGEWQIAKTQYIFCAYDCRPRKAACVCVHVGAFRPGIFIQTMTVCDSHRPFGTQHTTWQRQKMTKPKPISKETNYVCVY